MSKQENPIYSRINYEEAYYAKKDLLHAQLELLNIVRTIENHRFLRKQELVMKLKLKNDLKNLKEKISKLIEKSPKTNVITERITRNKQKTKIKKERKGLPDVEAELEHIQKKLREM